MPETLAAVRVGLLTKDKAPVPLTGVVVNAEISTLCARVTVTQRYVNREATPIEAVYVFPLDEGAAVCGFEALIDGTLVVGEVKERESAFRTYDEAIERGHGAYLLDEERPDVFQASVGNLPPGKEVLLKLTYVTELAVEGRQIRFTIPTTVSPRYAPAEDRIGVGRPDSDTLNPPTAGRVPYGLDLTVRLAMTDAIGKIESPSHPVSVSMNGNNATVTLSQRDTALDRDFVLSVDAAGLETPRGWIERDDAGAEAVAVALLPSLPNVSAPAEIVFLVDRSGSMGGQSIAEVRNALQLCLRSMIPGCSFNIVGFGSTFETLFDKSRPYDERSLAKASEHVAQLEANLGGTEILPALKHVLEQPPHAGLPRQVVILTDGEVTNTDALLELVTEHASNTRIFTFGIGASASQHLVKGLAQAGGGVAEFIHPGERIEAKVVRQFGRLLSPALTDVRLEWHGVDVTQAPSTVPPIFSGGRLLIYGFLKREYGGAVRATLSAHAPTGDVSFDVAIDPSRVRQGRTVAPLAARTRIRELEESPAWTKSRGSRQSDRRKSSVTQEIVELSTRYGVISRETSFVAVERRETPLEGEIQLRKVPIALAAGWGGLDMADAAPPMLSAMRAAPSAARPGGVLRDVMALSSKMFGSGERASQIPETVGKADALPSSPRNQNDRVTEDPLRKQLMSLIVLQRADGSWEMSSELERVIGRRDSLARGLQIADAIPLSRRLPDIWATALALAWLEQHAGRLHSEWEMVAQKGRRWLQHSVEELGDGRRWVQAAERFV